MIRCVAPLFLALMLLLVFVVPAHADDSGMAADLTLEDMLRSPCLKARGAACRKDLFSKLSSHSPETGIMLLDITTEDAEFLLGNRQDLTPATRMHLLFAIGRYEEATELLKSFKDRSVDNQEKGAVYALVMRGDLDKALDVASLVLDWPYENPRKGMRVTACRKNKFSLPQSLSLLVQAFIDVGRIEDAAKALELVRQYRDHDMYGHNVNACDYDELRGGYRYATLALSDAYTAYGDKGKAKGLLNEYENYLLKVIYPKQPTILPLPEYAYEDYANWLRIRGKTDRVRNFVEHLAGRQFWLISPPPPPFYISAYPRDWLPVVMISGGMGQDALTYLKGMGASNRKPYFSNPTKADMRIGTLASAIEQAEETGDYELAKQIFHLLQNIDPGGLTVLERARNQFVVLSIAVRYGWDKDARKAIAEAVKLYDLASEDGGGEPRGALYGLQQRILNGFIDEIDLAVPDRLRTPEFYAWLKSAGLANPDRGGSPENMAKRRRLKRISETGDAARDGDLKKLKSGLNAIYDPAAVDVPPVESDVSKKWSIILLRTGQYDLFFKALGALKPDVQRGYLASLLGYGLYNKDVPQDVFNRAWNDFWPGCFPADDELTDVDLAGAPVDLPVVPFAAMISRKSDNCFELLRHSISLAKNPRRDTPVRFQ